MRIAKTPNSVLGRKINCINYQMCPLCYGCRRFSKNDPDCIECAADTKTNICNTNKHTEDIISRFITKQKTIL